MLELLLCLIEPVGAFLMESLHLFANCPDFVIWIMQAFGPSAPRSVQNTVPPGVVAAVLAGLGLILLIEYLILI
jgi:hypothetical protein